MRHAFLNHDAGEMPHLRWIGYKPRHQFKRAAENGKSRLYPAPQTTKAQFPVRVDPAKQFVSSVVSTILLIRHFLRVPTLFSAQP